jgi:uncharacterized cupin superfamily protein
MFTLLGSDGHVVAERETRLPRYAVARLPAGAGGTIRAEGETLVLVVGASTPTSTRTDPIVADTAELEFTKPTISDILTARLTSRLGCRGIKANLRRLHPGGAVPYHTEGKQEELFTPLDSSGSIRVAGRIRSLNPGDVARVGPSIPRGVVNEADSECTWLMIGAPPTGAPDGWGPGAEVAD